MMDWDSLSKIMQTSVAYECTVCKLYFGTEDQLVDHLQTTHSRRLLVPVKTEKLEEEDETETCEEEEEEDHCSEFDGQRDWNSEACGKRKTLSSNLVDNGGPGLPASAELTSKSDGVNGDTDMRDSRGVGYSVSLLEIIAKRQYGCMTPNGFQGFTVPELKKFVSQVGALFAMEQQTLQQYFPSISNADTSTKETAVSLSNLEPSTMPSSGNQQSRQASASEKKNNGRCYKCGDPGHYVAACSISKNDKPKSKRRRRGGKRKRKYLENVEMCSAAEFLVFKQLNKSK